jgi:hypothetical protein
MFGDFDEEIIFPLLVSILLTFDLVLNYFRMQKKEELLWRKLSL